MATDLTIYLDDEPGELGRVAGLLGKEGVNISGFCAMTSGGGQGEVHLLVDDMPGAFTALQAGGIQVESEREVAVIPVEDRPGVLGEIAGRLAVAGANITLAYLATGTRLVIAADDLAAAKAALD